MLEEENCCKLFSDLHMHTVPYVHSDIHNNKKSIKIRKSNEADFWNVGLL